MKKVTNKVNCRDGLNMKIYGDLKDDIISSINSNTDGNYILQGQVMCDEMKLKGSLVWNTMTHEMISFSSDEPY